MTTKRATILRHVQDQVLREYNHSCAICNTANPHFHHIDGDTANNDPLNLLPLCPNCHLNDQHNPTRPLDPTRIGLFRRFKDPTILAAQFEPLFSRLRFLDCATQASADLVTLEASADELAEFVSALEMGSFYSKRIAELAGRIPHPRVSYSDTPASEREAWKKADLAEYVQKLSANRDGVLRLAVELLRYQNWLPPRAST